MSAATPIPRWTRIFAAFALPICVVGLLAKLDFISVSDTTGRILIGVTITLAIVFVVLVEKYGLLDKSDG